MPLDEDAHSARVPHARAPGSSGAARPDAEALLATYEHHLPADRRFDSTKLAWDEVIVAGYQESLEAGEFEAAELEHLLVVLVTDGDYFIQSKKSGGWSGAAFRPDSMAITAPGNVSTLRWSSMVPARPSSVHVLLDPHLFTDAPSRLDAIDGLVMPDPFVRESARLLGRAAVSDCTPLYAEALATAMAHHLARLSLGERPEQNMPDRGLAPMTLRAVIDYMHDHIAGDIRLADLADQAHFSRYYFLRKFKASTGLTPNAYLTDIRMRRAVELLSDSQRTVAAVASACGYRSVSQFSSVFMRRHGVRPLAFRAQNGTGSEGIGLEDRPGVFTAGPTSHRQVEFGSPDKVPAPAPLVATAEPA